MFEASKHDLVDKLKDMPTHLHMLEHLQKEAVRVEGLRDYRSNKNRHQYDLLHNYRESIGGLMFFMGSGIYPLGWNPQDAAAYIPLFEHLVSREIVQPEVLETLEKGATR